MWTLNMWDLDIENVHVNVKDYSGFKKPQKICSNLYLSVVLVVTYSLADASLSFQEGNRLLQ